MPDLPEVNQEFQASVEPYLLALDRMIAKTAELVGAVDEAMNKIAEFALAADDAATLISAAAEQVGKLDEVLAGVPASADAAAGGEERLGRESLLLSGILSELKSQTDDLMQAQLILAGGFSALDGKLDSVIAHAAATRAAISSLGDAMTALTAKSAAASAAGGGAGGFFLRGWLGGLRVTSLALHGIISGLIEFAAVAIPAAIAAGAWAAVWMQGANNVYNHMTAVYTATEATANVFHETAGQAVGLGDALQQAQNKANPQVYQALGAAILIVREHFTNLAQTGLQVGGIFDTFTAKLVQDFRGGLGTETTGLIDGMVKDLVQLAQILGNVGHALVNLMAAMPGFAHVLLDIADAVSKVVLWFSEWPRPLLEAVIILHELNTWGSIATAMLGRMGFATQELTGGFGSYFLVGGRFIAILKTMMGILPQVAFAVAGLAAKVPVLGAAVVGTTEDIDAAKAATLAWIGSLSALETVGIAAGVAAIAAYVVWAYRGRLATIQFDQSIENGIGRASNFQAFGKIASGMEQVRNESLSMGAGLSRTGEALGWFGGLLGDVWTRSEALQRSQNAQQATLQQLGQQFTALGTHAEFLANKYGISLPAAMGLAQAAGVSLAGSFTKQAWAIDQIKIQSLIAGYKAMGQSGNAVANDVKALAIAAGIQDSQVTKLNQAWDTYMGLITGGTSSLAAFDQSVSGLTTGLNSVSNVLGRSGSVSLSVKTFAEDLTKFTGQGAQAWQNFDQVVGSSAPQLIDWLRTAGAMGVLTGAQMRQAGLDMLAPLTALGSKTAASRSELIALAHDAGLNVHTFGDLTSQIKAAHGSTADLARIVEDATTKMGNMAAVAQALGTAIQNDIVNTMAAAKLQASGLNGDMVTLLEQLRNNTGALNASDPAYRQVIHDLEYLGYTAKQSRQLVKGLVDEQAQLHSRTISDTVTTHYTFTGQPGGPGTKKIIPHAAGTDYAARGPALVGERGPELVWMHGGEHVAPADKTSRVLSLAAGMLSGARGYAEGAMDAAMRANASRLPSSASGLATAASFVQPALAAAASGGGGGPVVLNVTIPVEAKLDGQVMARTQRTQTLIYNRRNVSSNLSLTRR